MAKRVCDKTKESVEIKDVTLNELSRFFNGPIRIRTSRFGLLRFQMITIGDLDFFQELIKHNPLAREFVIQIIHHQLFSPKLSVDTIRNWKEKLIFRVASIWVKKNPELAEYLTENELSIESIKKIIVNYMKKQHQYVSRQNEALVRMMNFSHPVVVCQEFESVQKLSEMTKLASGFENVQRISDIVLHNPALENVQRINDMVLHNHAFESVQRMSEMVLHNHAFESVQRMNDMVWQNPALECVQRMSDTIGHNPTLENVQRINDMVLHNPALESVQRMNDMVWQNPALESVQRIRGIMEIGQSFESAQRLGDIWTNQINASDLQLATISQYPSKEIALSQTLNSDLANLGRSFMDYFSLHSEFQQNYKQNKNGLPPIASELVARELFTTTTSVKSIFIGEELNEYDETEIIKEKISVETNDKLQLLLSELDPELVNLWLGAKEAISSDNSDNARHFNVSLRELFTHVLHKLAPDKEIRSWSTNPDDFRDGRPTRDARLRYIYRKINDDSFGALIKKFNSFSLELMDFLNRCTHKPRINMMDMQFRVIMMQIELLISQLIEVSQSNNSLTMLEKTNPKSFSPLDLPATGIGKED
jgi:hypothetical protein